LIYESVAVLITHLSQEKACCAKNSYGIIPKIVTALNPVSVDVGTSAHESPAELMPALAFPRNGSQWKNSVVRMQNLCHQVHPKRALVKVSPRPKAVLNEGSGQRGYGRPIFKAKHMIDSGKQVGVKRISKWSNPES
jgi:hypothetical protein